MDTKIGYRLGTIAAATQHCATVDGNRPKDVGPIKR
jgi:hypothetical protein